MRIGAVRALKQTCRGFETSPRHVTAAVVEGEPCGLIRKPRRERVACLDFVAAYGQTLSKSGLQTATISPSVARSCVTSTVRPSMSSFMCVKMRRFGLIAASCSRSDR